MSACAFLASLLQRIPTVMVKDIAPLDVFAQEEEEQTGDVSEALHRAAARNDADALLKALRAGAPIDGRGPKGFTALEVASSAGHLESVKVLVSLKADVGSSTSSSKGRDAASIALQAGHPACAAFLRARQTEEKSPPRRAPRPWKVGDRCRRRALVIGNSRYLFQDVPHALADAQVVAQALEQIRFEVFVHHNATNSAMREAVTTFVGRLSPLDVALVYFVGVGERRGKRSLLFGTDNKFTVGVPEGATVMEDILEDLQMRGSKKFRRKVQGESEDDNSDEEGPYEEVVADGSSRQSDEHGASVVIVDAARAVRTGNRIWDRDSDEWRDSMSMPGQRSSGESWNAASSSEFNSSSMNFLPQPPRQNTPSILQAAVHGSQSHSGGFATGRSSPVDVANDSVGLAAPAEDMKGNKIFAVQPRGVAPVPVQTASNLMNTSTASYGIAAATTRSVGQRGTLTMDLKKDNFSNPDGLTNLDLKHRSHRMSAGERDKHAQPMETNARKNFELSRFGVTASHTFGCGDVGLAPQAWVSLSGYGKPIAEPSRLAIISKKVKTRTIWNSDSWRDATENLAKHVAANVPKPLPLMDLLPYSCLPRAGLNLPDLRKVRGVAVLLGHSPWSTQNDEEVRHQKWLQGHGRSQGSQSRAGGLADSMFRELPSGTSERFAGFSGFNAQNSHAAGIAKQRRALGMAHSWSSPDVLSSNPNWLPVIDQKKAKLERSGVGLNPGANAVLKAMASGVSAVAAPQESANLSESDWICDVCGAASDLSHPICQACYRGNRPRAAAQEAVSFTEAASPLAEALKHSLRHGRTLVRSLQEAASKVLEISERRQKPCLVVSPGIEQTLL